MDKELKRALMDDLIVLGNAVPDEIHDGRKTVCTVCYSQKHGLVRIYPVPPRAPMKRWNMVSVPLQQTSRDTRQESWKVQGSKDEWPRLAQKIKLIKQLPSDKRSLFIREIYDKFGVGCIQDLNDKCLSLGLIKPNIIDCRMADREKVKSGIQTTLDSKTPFRTIHNYPKQPRATYRCADCKSVKPHDQQIIEWGAYEFMRRYPENPPEQCLTNMHLMDSMYEKHFLVGNLAKHRTSFVVVSVFRFKTL